MSTTQTATEVPSIFGWDLFFIYLSGPIDFTHDAVSWRDALTERLIDIGFKRRQILNPCKKPLLGIPFLKDNEWDTLKQLRAEGKWDEFCELESQIAAADLTLVNKSQMVIVYFPKLPGTDYPMPTFGTIHEIVRAREQKKPVYVVWEGGKQLCSAWIMWLVKHQNVFGTFDELLQHLCDVRDGKAIGAKRWLLLNPED